MRHHVYFSHPIGGEVRSQSYSIQLLAHGLRSLRVGLVEVLQVWPEQSSRQLQRSSPGRRGLSMGWVRRRDQLVNTLVAESLCGGRSALVSRTQRNRSGGQAGGARVPDETQRNTRSAGQRTTFLLLLVFTQ